MKRHSVLILSFLTVTAVLSSIAPLRDAYSELENPVVTVSPPEARVGEQVLVEANITVKVC